MAYRYTAWSPYAEPFTVPALTQVINSAHLHPASPSSQGSRSGGRYAGHPGRAGVGPDRTGRHQLGRACAPAHRQLPRRRGDQAHRGAVPGTRRCARGRRTPGPPNQVVASLPLADHVGLEASRPLRLEFTLSVPPQPQAPRLRMPNFTLSWMLRGVVDRRLHRDPCVTVEVQAVTIHNERGGHRPVDWARRDRDPGGCSCGRRRGGHRGGGRIPRCRRGSWRC